MRRESLYLTDIVEAADHIAAFIAEMDFLAIPDALAWVRDIEKWNRPADVGQAGSLRGGCLPPHLDVSATVGRLTIGRRLTTG
jgi:hypothetical protein